jgi:CopG family nickel-responsive transcriptional regulator
MAIISLSLPTNMLDEVDKLAREGGYKGRSDAIRDGIMQLSRDLAQGRGIKGRVSGALLLAHDEDDEEAFSEARHKFESLIKTSIHNQLPGDKCLEVFILEGDANDVQELVKACRRSGKARQLKLVLA